MKYQVYWPARLRRKLLDFYALTVQGSGRETAEMNRALTDIEVALERTPAEAGEERGGNLRVIIISPLAVDFTVLDSERRVVVKEVRYSRGRRP